MKPRALLQSNLKPNQQGSGCGGCWQLHLFDLQVLTCAMVPWNITDKVFKSRTQQVLQYSNTA